ncbi:carbohydrate ABC transporter permease [Butyrivibrio sp. MC2013]|uniref:carbohydrate ABC transporter permease n=1 Tax=Butyrivibrio sp. MC2013 TaxID=1280686 RepID=UPI000404CA17|nr:carbohydrate ABC transporter permease [Butyrivibrio sp. MC2013]
MKSTFIINNKIGRFFIYLIMVLGIVSVFAPLLIVLNVSLKSNEEYMMKGVMTLPENITNISNFIRAYVEGNFTRGFINTGLLVVVSVPVTVIIASLVAYTLSRFDFKCRKIVYLAFLIPTFIPGMTVTIATFQVIKALGLYNSILAGIILYIGTDIMQIYIFLQFISKVPISLDESAMLDGAGRLRIYTSIILPQLGPAIATTVILKLLGIYNDFFTPYMYMPKVKTVATGLYAFSGDKLAEWPLMSAAIVLVAIPTIIIYIFLQKYIISGVTDGAVK